MESVSLKPDGARHLTNAVKATAPEYSDALKRVAKKLREEATTFDEDPTRRRLPYLFTKPNFNYDL
jgi:hypothetical protein